MKRVILTLLVLTALAFADKPTGKWNFSRMLGYLPNGSSAWYIEPSKLEFEGKYACHYVGQVTIAPDRNGDCFPGTLHHLAKVTVVTDGNDRIKGMLCAYDYQIPGGHFDLMVDNIRESCPDMILTLIMDMEPVVMGEYYFKPMDNQAKYYQDGAPIRQILPSSREILDRFGKKYENQIRYRDTYDWVMLRPGAGWDLWERPGSAYETGPSKTTSERVWR